MQSKLRALRKGWLITAHILAVVFLGTLAGYSLVPGRHLCGQHRRRLRMDTAILEINGMNRPTSMNPPTPSI